MAVNPRYLDRRTFERYLEKGLLAPEDVQAHMKSLPDSADNAQYVEMDLHDAEMAGDEMVGENGDQAEEEAP